MMNTSTVTPMNRISSSERRILSRTNDDDISCTYSSSSSNDDEISSSEDDYTSSGGGSASDDDSSDVVTSNDEDDDELSEEKKTSTTKKNKNLCLEPYIAKLERFELFSTAQAYYLIGSDKDGTAFRVLVLDRTRMLANPNKNGNSKSSHHSSSSESSSQYYSQQDQNQQQSQEQQQHGGAKFQRLCEFCREDPTVYTASEIHHVLEMIHDGNIANNSNNHNPVMDHYSSSSHNSVTSNNSSSGLKPIGKAFGIVGFIRFLDCYYLTLITKRAKVGSIGGNDIYSIRQTETVALKPAERSTTASTTHNSSHNHLRGSPHRGDNYYYASSSSSHTSQQNSNSNSNISSEQNYYYNQNSNSDGNNGSNNHSSNNNNNNASSDPSSVLLNMWNRGKRSVGLGFTNSEMAELRYQGLYQVMDLTKNNFFFSYTYDVTRSLQDNFLAMTAQPFPPPPIQEMYAWNYFLTRELEEEDIISKDTQHHWVLPIIHGAFVQRTIQDYGQHLNLTLLARRSRHFAGTRYLKRGVSDRGKVANDVEHEQILLHVNNMTFSSYLQVRGSIPTFWTQETSVTMPKPPIILSRVDPTYHATQMHISDLLKRYGSPIVILDLVKQSEKREREVIVGNEFRHAIDYLNSHILENNYKIPYCALDYSHISKHRNLNVSTSLKEAAVWAVNQTGFFCSAPRWKIVENNQVEPFHSHSDPTDTYTNNNNRSSETATKTMLTQTLGIPVFPMEQKGILRTNCIDCLDRTNVAQFSAGVEALGQQLVVIGVRSCAKLDPTSNIVKLLIDMYVEIGDHIALQYGGSEAHKKVQTAAGTASNINGPMGKHKELLTSIRRYYSNAFTDQAKQDAMNLFLGYYIPSRHAVPLWDMENDYYLHNFHVKAGRGSLQSMKKYQQLFAVGDWSNNASDDDDDDEDDGDENNYDDIHRRATTKVKSPLTELLKLENDANDLTQSDNINTVSKEIAKEPWHIARVRKRCKAQNEALSLWWKVAVHQYIQQRMWMQLGRGATESRLPPRFERLYQPDKLSQFDKLFARSWAAPVRLSHSAQHQSPSDDDELLLIRRRVKSLPENNSDKSQSNHHISSDRNENDSVSSHDNEGVTTLKDYVNDYGLDLKTTPTLPIFMSSQFNRKKQKQGMTNWHGIVGQPKKSRPDSIPEFSTDIAYLGDIRNKGSPCEEFIRYANPISPNPIAPDFRKSAREEFTKCLQETSLDSDDVEGIQKLSESAHIGNEIRTGPYRGLSQHESAIEVTTVIYEQFDTLGNMQKRGEIHSGALPGVDENLKRRQMDTPGVIEAVFAGWDRFSAEEKAYQEIMDVPSLSRRRSDLTDESSLRIYSSFVEESSPLSELDISHLNGYKVPTKNQKPMMELKWRKDGKSAFANKAASMGIPTASRRNRTKLSNSSLYSQKQNREIPIGFEQINEDLYARNDNRFMVFNGAGLDSWRGRVPNPLTKVEGIEKDILIR